VDDAKFKPHLLAFIKALGKASCEKIIITKHNRNLSSYDPQKVLDADLVIVGTNDINSTSHNIAKGCKSEIESANAQRIPVFAMSMESYKVNNNPRGLYIHRIGNKDVHTVDENNWKLGHAFISMYCAAGNNAPSTFLNNNETFVAMLKQLDMLSNETDIEVQVELADQKENESYFKKVSERTVAEVLNVVEQAEKPRRSMLLVRRKMRK
jgi:hypothetical protein